MAFASLESWVEQLQANGRYTFRRKEAIEESGLSPESTKKALQRLKLRGRIAMPKDYFFVVVPLEYSTAGSPPVSWFIHDLMTAMDRPYYVALLSAAGLHGASHHQPQEFQVITDRPIRPITLGRARIRFFSSKSATNSATIEMKTPTGRMRVSTPEATTVDLVRFSKASGQMDNVASVIAELAPKLKSSKLLEAVKLVDDIANTQRLGYILDSVGASRLTPALSKFLKGWKMKCVKLRSSTKSDAAEVDDRWQVAVDRPLEIET